MRILAHRGDWSSPDEKNSQIAFQRALASGNGIETDLRDFAGEVVISHDPPRGGEQRFDSFLDQYISFPNGPPLALNIKSDGLAQAVLDLLCRRGVNNYFVFDMSVPDSLHYFSRAMNVYSRRSEYEIGSSLDDKAAGLWLDWFSEGHVPVAVIEEQLSLGRRIAIVSPELHRRPHHEAWAAWKPLFDRNPSDQIMLCTDFCREAKGFFGG